MIENITEYEKDNLKTFIYISLKRTRLLSIISSIIVLVFSIVYIILEPKDWIFSLILCVVAIISLILVLIMPNIYVNRATVAPKIKNVYKFWPEKLNIVTFSNDDEISNVEWGYSLISKIVEYKNLLLLYLNNKQALIININSFKNPNDKEIIKRYIYDNNKIVSRETKKWVYILTFIFNNGFLRTVQFRIVFLNHLY